MVSQTTPYGIGITIRRAFGDAVLRVKEALVAEGFGVLTEIDVAATMQAKLNVDFGPYVILGACNPPLAYRALLTERDVGLLLPCNVIVYAGEVAGESVVAALDPVAALGVAGNQSLAPLAEEVLERLVRVLQRVEHEDAFI